MTAIGLIAVAASASDLPVTKGEVNSTISRMASVLKSILKVNIDGSMPAIEDTPKAASRIDVVHSFYALFKKCQPKFKFTPRKGPVEKIKPVKGDDTKVKQEIEELVQWGCLAPVGPVAAGPSATMKVEEFGDAVGFFLSRIAELTHNPSAKFSPYLMDGALPKSVGNSKSKNGSNSR